MWYIVQYHLHRNLTAFNGNVTFGNSSKGGDGKNTVGPGKPAIVSCRRYIANGLQKPSVVEPIDPFKGGKLNGLEVSPWSAPVDHLGLVKTVDNFGESIVVGISDTADRRLYACFSQARRVFD